MRHSLLLALLAVTACDSAWLETPSAERARLAIEEAQRVERALATLPGVQRATLLYTPPASGLAALPETESAATATVLLVRTEHTQPAAQAARALIVAALPNLTDSSIHVAESERPALSPAAPQLAQLGPITVASASLPTLKAWLAAGLVLQMLLCIAVLRPLLRRRP